MLNHKPSTKRGMKFRIYPTDVQSRYLNKVIGCCRFVYNHSLGQIKEVGRTPSKYTLINNIIDLKKEYSWLTECSSTALQQSVIDLSTAYSMFFKKVSKYPVFKKKGFKNSFRLVGNTFGLRNNRLRLEKCPGDIKIQWGGLHPINPSSVTITRTPSGKFYASFMCEFIPQSTSGKKVIGIDLGLKSFLVTSDGNEVENPKCFNRGSRKLKRLQQSLSRKIKGSNNRNKDKIKVAICHERIANRRSDFLHKLSRNLVNESQVIGVESLRVSNLIKNRKLSKSIQDAAWSIFRRFLIYKATDSSHCKVVEIGRFYPSSHICGNTGLRLERKLRLSERWWDCPHCGERHDRDLNAAINILNESLRVLSLLSVEELAKVDIIFTEVE